MRSYYSITWRTPSTSRARVLEQTPSLALVRSGVTNTVVGNIRVRMPRMPPPRVESHGAGILLALLLKLLSFFPHVIFADLIDYIHIVVVVLLFDHNTCLWNNVFVKLGTIIAIRLLL